MMPDRIGTIGSTHGVKREQQAGAEERSEHGEQVAAADLVGEQVLLGAHARRRLRAEYPRQACAELPAPSVPSLTTIDFLIGG